MLKSYSIAAAFLAAASPLALAETPDSGATKHILNLSDVEITALIEDVSTVTGYTFIVHPDVRTKRVTVSSNTPMTSREVFDVFLSTLRVNGFSAVPAGRDTYRIVPQKAAIGDAGLSGDGQNALVTEIIKLSNFRANEAASMVRPMVEGRGQVLANPNSNTLVVVDFASNMRKIRELVSELDQSREQTITVSLANIPAQELEQILTQLNAKSGESGYGNNLKAVASQTGNAIVLSGTTETVSRAQKVAEELDSYQRSEDDLRVIQLNNAGAEELVPILDRVGTAIASRRRPGSEVPQHIVDFHAPTNSLVISADAPTLLAMERVIKELDQRRAQVLVEAIIVDMSDDVAQELGLQFLLSGSNDSTVPFVSTNYSRSAPNLLALAGALISDNAAGDDTTSTLLSNSAVTSLLGLNGATIGVGGQSGDTLFGAILNAVETDTNSRVLSKPFNMTLDNGTSSLLVGQDVPIATGEVLGDDNSNPFRTVDRKEIGIQLDVTPRISSDDTVRLDIYQEVSNINGVISIATSDLVIDTRKIETSVLADSGEIIVIGGLIEQQETFSEEGVPILSDIPGLGRLFRTEGEALTRTNLMVFIKPTIVRDKEAARDATSRSYRYIRAEELWDGEADSSLDDFVSTVLGSPPPQ